MSARILTHQYHLTGRNYFTVQCDECLVVLNSGHHYADNELAHAADLASAHNAEQHADPEEAEEALRAEADDELDKPCLHRRMTVPVRAAEGVDMRCCLGCPAALYINVADPTRRAWSALPAMGAALEEFIADAGIRDSVRGRPKCAIALASHVGTPATWVQARGTTRELFVCDRHKAQYEERSDEFGPFRWEALS